MPPSNKPVLMTIWHTGTNYLMQKLDVDQMHCSPENIEKAKDREIITTYRDPLEVAASWANRYGKEKPIGEQKELEKEWFKQWDCWHQILDRAKVYNVAQFEGRKVKSFTDRGAHKALKQRDLETYFTFVPRRWIDGISNTQARA